MNEQWWRDNMTGFWLVSYIALWLFVFLETLLLLAFIRHIGNLRLWLRQAGVIRDLQPVEEGPPIGKSITGLDDVLRESLAGTIELDSQKAKALIFVPAGFFGCDDLLLALKEFEHEHSETFQVIIVSFMPGVAGQFEVARKLGVQVPIITENGWKLASLCPSLLHHMPSLLIQKM
jgi:hypothetical protein